MATFNIIETIGLSKSYPGVQALDSVDFDLRRGEVQALVGQNGAGKSTFVEIIAGAIRPDSGEIVFDGVVHPFLEPHRSIELGIQTVHQENQLVDELTVGENIYLFDLPHTPLGFVNQSTCFQVSERLLSELGISISPRKKIRELTFIEQKLVSIAKAFSRQARVLILDEPTASLDEQSRGILFDVIKRNTEKGLSVIYISHNLSEIYEICDRVTVFRDGKKIATHTVNEVGMGQIVHQMIGRASDFVYKRTREESPTERSPTLEVMDYHQPGVVEHVSFSVREGEIFGIGGLVGSGRTELARMIFGIDQKKTGRLLYDGKEVTPRSPHDAIRKGIGFLTEDRKSTGLVMGRPIFENISVVHFAKSGGLFLDLTKEHSDTEKMAQALDVKTPSTSRPVLTLSGGNQQKVVLAKWLFAESQVLIIDEPTVGIDIGAKREIYRMMDELAAEGKVIIMISSDNQELTAVSDRVGIMRGGALVAVLEGDEIDEETILRYAMGVGEED